MRPPMTGRDDEQVQIVIAEHRGCGRTERLHGAKHRQRIRTSIHQIADEPQPVARRLEGDDVEKLAEFRVAALNVADDVVTHDPLSATLVAVDAKVRLGSRRYFFSVRIQFTRALMSSSGTALLGGMGTCPQTPAPPLFTFCASF